VSQTLLGTFVEHVFVAHLAHVPLSMGRPFAAMKRLGASIFVFALQRMQ
jgi:hypothetical protein